jgi:hypothetical protein
MQGSSSAGPLPPPPQHTHNRHACAVLLPPQVFPDAEHKVSGPEWSKCATQGLAHKPKKGDALMFYRWGQRPGSCHGGGPELLVVVACVGGMSFCSPVHPSSFSTTHPPLCTSGRLHWAL